MAQNFSMRSISLNIGNHLKALSMILASRDSSFSFMSSSCLCISLRLWICVSCCFCICCIWLCNFSILVSRFETSSCSFSLACSSSFSFPLPKREATPLVMAVAAALLWWLSSLACQCVFLISPVSVPVRQDLSVLLCAVWQHPCVAVRLSASQ